MEKDSETLGHDVSMKSIIEALLFTAKEPLPVKRLARYLNISHLEVEEYLQILAKEYEDRESGTRIGRVGGGIRLETRPAMATHIQAFHHPPREYPLSRAALETLAIIAYRQPVTRGEVETIRGVKVEKSLKTLKGHHLIEEKGRLETLGRPILYGTGKVFLEYFGLNSLEDLPPLNMSNIMKE